MKDRRHRCRVLVAGATIALGLAPGLAQIRAQDRQISVLALHEARREAPVPAAADAILQRVLGAGLSGRLDFYSESIDLPRFPEPAYHEAFQTFFLAKHAGRRFDVVVTTIQATFDFAIRHRDHLFCGSPIVFNVRGAGLRRGSQRHRYRHAAHHEEHARERHRAATGDRAGVRREWRLTVRPELRGARARRVQAARIPPGVHLGDGAADAGASRTCRACRRARCCSGFP